jgi:hypothetical protein
MPPSYHPPKRQTHTTNRTKRARREWAQFQTWISDQDKAAEAQLMTKLRVANLQLRRDLTTASRKEQLELRAQFRQLEQNSTDEVQGQKWAFAQAEWTRRLEREGLRIEDWVAGMEDEERAECEEKLGIKLEDLSIAGPSEPTVTANERTSPFGISAFDIVPPENFNFQEHKVPSYQVSQSLDWDANILC